MTTQGFGKESRRRSARAAVPAGAAERSAKKRSLPEAQPEAKTKPPIWHKNNVGFWLAVCIVISLIYSLIDSAMH